MNTVCESDALHNIYYLIGVVVAVIRVAVPVILIVMGMVDLVKALTSQDDKQIKSATNLLVKRVVIGIAVFLVPTIVRLVMSVISQNEFDQCGNIRCITSVWSNGCSWKN
jgi:putative Mn2+ efflux pump MntP